MLTRDAQFLLYSVFCFLTSVLKLALFGFVFLEPEDDFIFIIPCSKGGCINFMHKQIGSVCKKIGPICRGFSTIVEKVSLYPDLLVF